MCHSANNMRLLVPCNSFSLTPLWCFCHLPTLRSSQIIHWHIFGMWQEIRPPRSSFSHQESRQIQRQDWNWLAGTMRQHHSLPTHSAYFDETLVVNVKWSLFGERQKHIKPCLIFYSITQKLRYLKWFYLHTLVSSWSSHVYQMFLDPASTKRLQLLLHYENNLS